MIAKQQGAAAIYFIFIIGAIMSMGVLAIEGSRYIGKKARLGDAMEAASIAVAEADITKADFNQAKANHLAKQWLGHLVTDAQKMEISTSRKIKENHYGISNNSPTKFAYYRYDIEAVSTHESWFKFTNWPAFDKEVKVANTGAAGRIQGAPIDIVFVADFSESMDNDQKGYQPNGKEDDDDKIDLLKKIVTDVTTALHKNNPESSFAFIPFTKRIVIQRTDAKGKLRFYCVSPLLSPQGSVFESVRKSPAFPKLVLTMHKKDHKCKTSDTEAYGRKERTHIYNDYCFTKEQISVAERYLFWLCPFEDSDSKSHFDLKDNDDDCDEDEDYIIGHECSKMPFRYKNNLRIDYNPTDMTNSPQWNNHIDIKRTAKEINLSKLPLFSSIIPYDHLQDGLFDDDDDDGIDFERHCAEWEDDDNVPEHYVLDRRKYYSTKDLNKHFLDKIEEMEEDGGTDMYQGLLAAPSQFYGATNKERVIVVLSDGLENNDMFDKLEKAGLCKNIKRALSHNSKGESHNVHLLFVKFSHREKAKGDDDDDEELDHHNSLPVYKRCFGENIIDANKHDKISDAILNHLTDETGHNFYR
ncbi:hypothetical protein A3K86_15065 [Photobacterium jeanii]|uniref:Uncharacterized protein n=1 Tax=Photobacterium jeanii TaxID=858640 RepID=A0A178K6M6_9GAMM|nr:hypothetical protein [Photobacterium jeanii]OAN12989.1 hypothetical protein A3K86_15065 [Photobacterium jeanii]PST89136.1 hypothetical protein C9I91_13510 [Photobacterium jeanii]